MNSENPTYNFWARAAALDIPMAGSKPSSASHEPFGKRLARLRKEAGYSQRSLANEIGISYRMVAYYEAETTRPPSALLPSLADALGLTTDQLLGREAVTPRKRPQNQHLLRKLRLVERLPPRARNAVLEHIDALAEKHGLAG